MKILLNPVFAFVGAGMATCGKIAESAAAFEYDRRAALDVKVHSTSLRNDGVSVIDIDFASPCGGAFRHTLYCRSVKARSLRSSMVTG